MKIIVADSISAAGTAAADDLRSALGLEILIAGSRDEMFRLIETHKDAIGVVIYFIDEGPELGMAAVRRIKETSRDAAVRCPRVLILTAGNLSAAYESRFRAMGAECLIHGYPNQMHATVRRMIFEAKCENEKSTIVVDRSDGTSRFYWLGPAKRESISCGPRLLKLMNYFAINFGVEISTETLAEIAGTTVSSVKVYLKRLRYRLELASENAGVAISGRQVICTFRKDGGYVHVLRARVLFV
jgi:hypothetical protein